MRKRSQRGPLASRRSAAALAPATERQDLAQAALHAKHDTKALPSPRIALKRCTSRPGRCAGGVDARTARGAGVTSPRPQEPHPLRQSASPVDVPHEERDGAVIVIAAAKSKDLNLSRWIMRFSRRAVSRKERAANMICRRSPLPACGERSDCEAIRVRGRRRYSEPSRKTPSSRPPPRTRGEGGAFVVAGHSKYPHRAKPMRDLSFRRPSRICCGPSGRRLLDSVSRDLRHLQGFQTLGVRRKTACLPPGLDLFQNCRPISLRIIKQASQCGAFVLYIFEVDTVLARIECRDPREQLARQGEVADQARSDCRAIDVSAPRKIACKEAMDVRKRPEPRPQRAIRCHKTGRRFDQRSKLLDTLVFDVTV